MIDTLRLWWLALRVSPADLAYYDGITWRRLSRGIRARDGWQCRRCGSRQYLHCHHRIRWAWALDRGWLMFRLAQLPPFLETLCNDCHELAHGRDLNGDRRVGPKRKRKVTIPIFYK